jgi:pimeloyl-ACP methyl ester carboxylesterase
MSNWSSDDIVSNGIRIRYHRTGGEKPSLLIAHGVTDNALSWSRFAQSMEQDFDVILYDRRGHGFSDKPASLIIEDPAWGTAWGGWESTTTGMIEWFQETVSLDRNELVATCHETNPNWPNEEVELWADSKVQVSPYVVQTFEQAEPNWRDIVREITCPIMLIAGDTGMGSINSAADVEAMAAIWTSGQAVTIKGAGHMVHYDRFGAYISAVKTFLSDIH